MKTKKIILAITCVLMMIALTQSASAVQVSRTGWLEWQQGNFFTITFTHGNTQTFEVFHKDDVTINGCINDGDDVVITYTNTLTQTFVEVDGVVYEVWVWMRTNINVISVKNIPPVPRGIVDLR